MLLPGGLLRGGELKRRIRLREPDGALELFIADAARRATSFQDGVSRVVAALVEDVDGESLDHQSAHELCIADRQFVMHRATSMLDMAHHWITTTCAPCGAKFDVAVDFEQLPVGDAGPGFPFVTIETDDGPLRLRVPTGSDQVAVDALSDAELAERELLRRCVVDGELPPVPSRDDVARIEAALDEVSPWVVTELEGLCPKCRAAHPVPLDPYVVMHRSVSHVLDEVHVLAWHYHWSEAEILGLPRRRRQLYLSRIDRARGLTS